MRPADALRAYRLSRGWSQHEVAERLVALGRGFGEADLRVTGATVGRWERGERFPQPPYRKLLCLLFDASAAEFGLVPAPYALPDHPGDGGEGRALLRVLPGGLATPGLAAGDVAAEAGRPVHVPGTMPKRDRAVVLEVASGIALARQTDDVLGPRAAAPVAMAQRELVRASLQGSPSAALTRKLVAAAADVSQLLAWLAYDLDDHDISRDYLEETLGLAHEAGDDGLAAYALGHLSNLEVAGERPQTGLALVRAARAGAEGRASCATRSWLATAEARALAELGERAGAERALDEARTAFARSRPEDEPSWMYYYDGSELDREAGSVYLHLRLAEPARRAMLQGLTTSDPSMVRDRANCLARLGRTYALDGELEEACRLGAQALALAAATGSDRVAAQVCKLRAELGSRPSDPVVRELDDLLAATLGRR